MSQTGCSSSLMRLQLRHKMAKAMYWRGQVKTGKSVAQVQLNIQGVHGR